MASSSFPTYEGHESRRLTYKIAGGLQLKLDVLFPLKSGGKKTLVVLHLHGGFLMIGDRFSLQPHWLINAAVRRGWVFVSPDYRLVPETTASFAVEDAKDAYEWVVDNLANELNIKIDGVILAGSSAGAYLALTTASLTSMKPKSLVLLYGMLDLTNERYTTKGTNILGLPSFDGQPIIAEFLSDTKGRRKALSGYPWPSNPSEDPRFAFIAALHLEAKLIDVITGLPGLGAAIAAQGPNKVIPDSARNLFPVTFSELNALPPTIILHGKNDLAIPFDVSRLTASKMATEGVEVTTEFPDDAQHGFDVLLGPVDLEDLSIEVPESESVRSLRNVIKFLDSAP